MYFLSPAMESAPAGSQIERVSVDRLDYRGVAIMKIDIMRLYPPSKISLMAAQISSLLTKTISSTNSDAILNGSSPTNLTAAPSANNPTSFNASCHRVRVHRFHPNHLNIRGYPFDVARDPGD
ncbi:hypothetical protein BC937DRAFT_88364 [Endogone sp. FLAS-F59071]|nr:hypothetical protein BC937DRAFT_88364 [Endogone sp. FLAS-F59071]|eukprot:RUS22577.1 hypothetical protein BC937DRAFT_88364 [Endogone sp. FLAS-F59071]